MESLRMELKELIISKLELSDVTIDQISDDMPLFVEGLGLDSIDALELHTALSERYGIEQELEVDEARERFRTIATLADWVQSVRTV